MQVKSFKEKKLQYNSNENGNNSDNNNVYLQRKKANAF